MICCCPAPGRSRQPPNSTWSSRSRSRRQAVLDLLETPEGLILYTKEALETLLPLCTQVQRDTAIEPVPSIATGSCRLRTVTDGGRTVLTLAYRPVSNGYDHPIGTRPDAHWPGRPG